MRGAGVTLAVAALLCAMPLPTPAAQPLRTGVGFGAGEVLPADQTAAFQRIRAAGASVVRLQLSWNEVARVRPANGRNPADPAYDWGVFDWQVADAIAAGLEPLVGIDNAPTWAQDRSSPLPWEPAVAVLRGDVRTDPVAYGDFAHAAALHYGGSLSGIPRVRVWIVLNEPNLSAEQLPQFVGRRAVSVDRYRRMLNALAAGVHSVHSDNVVVAGGLAPFGTRTKFAQVVAPQRFLRELVCMSKGPRPRPTCRQRATFDAWGVHPYTAGGPTHRATAADDVSLGDLPEVKRLLDAAARAGHIRSRRPPQLWVTEFSWDTRPPDPNPLVAPIRLHARWVSEAVHEAWRSGATMFIWYALRDLPDIHKHYQSGLYFRGGDALDRDAPKPALASFRFPFVAYRSGVRASFWGRTPGGRAGRVVVEENGGGGWQHLATVRADASGVFEGGVRLTSRLRRRSAPPERLAAYRAAVRADWPLSYWTLDEVGGSSARDLAGGRNATYRGRWTSVPGAISGTRDRAVSLDGKSGVVSLGRVPAPRTVELWLKTQTGLPTAAFSDRNDASRYVYLGLGDDVHALAFDGASIPGRAWVTDGRWHHLVYTYDGSVGRLYVDGRLDGSAAVAKTEGEWDATIGYDAALRRHLRGSVDEVAIYGYALTKAQIERHFVASGRPPDYADEFAIMGSGLYVRARLAGSSDSSLPFSLRRAPDRYVLPLGL